MCATIFLRSVGDRPKKSRLKAAITAVVAVSVILLIAAIFGATILDLFGVSLSAFACAGGGILVWIGANTILSSQNKSQKDSEPVNNKNETLTPLILFAASPGTITGVITVAASNSNQDLPLTAMIAVAVTSILLLVTLLVTAQMGKKNRDGGILQQAIASYMGVIIIAMGIQFALTGFKNFMASS